MAIIMGHEGICTFPTAVISAIGINTWSATYSFTTTDITAFGDTGRVRRTGIADIQGSAGGFVDSSQTPFTDTVVGSVGGTLLLGMQTGNHISFSAIFDQVALSSSIEGDASVTWNFQMSDADGPSFTWG
jgi:hypothetical protein